MERADEVLQGLAEQAATAIKEVKKMYLDGEDHVKVSGAAEIVAYVVYGALFDLRRFTLDKARKEAFGDLKRKMHRYTAGSVNTINLTDFLRDAQLIDKKMREMVNLTNIKETENAVD